MKLRFALVFIAAGLQSIVAQDLALNPLFTDHAVLQQEIPAPVWGTAKPGSKVTVSFAGQSHTATADESGKWMLALSPLTVSSEPQTLTASSGEETLSIKDILVGEVWVGSGQSNMAMAVKNSFDAENMVKEAEVDRFKGIRLFKVPVSGADERASSVNASWTLPHATAVSSFSATAFFFARKLAQDRNVPVGIIQSANGGTNAFSWVNSETIADDPATEDVRTYWEATLKNYPSSFANYEKAKTKWKEKAAAAKANGETFSNRAPREPLGKNHVKRPAGHYNAMIAPLQPFAIRGAVWYQGEANSRVPFYSGYKDLMFSLVEDWRADWATASGDLTERRDFPFYLVQLPNFANGDETGWPMIREQMLKFWQEGENTGMVVTIDVGEATDIHPRNKRPVGERLATFARGTVYGEDLVYSGPIFESLRIEGEKAILTFQHIGGGLKSLDGEPLKYFQIANGDGGFVEADAKIVGDTIVVSSETVKEPRAVRYAWKNNPEGTNLGNQEGFPASPFRTDGWEK